MEKPQTLSNSTKRFFNILLTLFYLFALTLMMGIFVDYVKQIYFPNLNLNKSIFNIFFLIIPLFFFIFTIKDLKIRERASILIYFSPLILNILVLIFSLQDEILLWFLVGPFVILLGVPFLIWVNLKDDKEKIKYLNKIIILLIIAVTLFILGLKIGLLREFITGF